MDIVLNDIEVRVLGCLLEKSYTTPEYYPLSLNSLTNACNQKSNRYPVVSYDEKTVVRGLEGLKKYKLVVQGNSGRVIKYSENLVSSQNFLTQEAALLCVLFLRGPQTPGELRGRTERIYKFADTDEVCEVLEDLIDAGFILMLPRQAGRKEHRYCHLFSGEPSFSEEELLPRIPQVVMEVQAENDRITKLEEKVNSLHEQLLELNRQFDRFKSEFE